VGGEDLNRLDGAETLPNNPTLNLQPLTGTIKLDLCIHQRADRNSASLGAHLKVGQSVTVMGRTDDCTWFKIQVGTDIGWVNAAYLTISNEMIRLPVV
jgi:hypothetical protein